ncbi:MAG TPA: hypothetical protein VF796_14220 [Humisphaera sp.]
MIALYALLLLAYVAALRHLLNRLTIAWVTRTGAAAAMLKLTLAVGGWLSGSVVVAACNPGGIGLGLATAMLAVPAVLAGAVVAFVAAAFATGKGHH